MPLKPTKYQQVDATSEPMKAQLESPGGPQTPSIVRGAAKPKETGKFSGSMWKYKNNHQKHDQGNLQLCFENQRHINNLTPPRAPPGPIELLGLQFHKGCVTFFKDPIKNQKV